jgi:hypothetical protein
VRRDAIRDAGLRELGATSRLNKIAFDGNGRPRPYPERCKLTEEYKSELKKHQREVALECHPDRNIGASDDVLKEQGSRFNRVTRAVNFLMTLSPQEPRPPRPVAPRMVPQGMPPGVVMVINLGNRGIGITDLRHGSATATGTTTSGGNQGYWPWHG